MAVAAALFLLAMTADEVGLSSSDLPAYWAALGGAAKGPVRLVSFRDLWDRPESFRGTLVRVEGRIVRSFESPASGEFPRRVEVWLATPSDDVICAVFPEKSDVRRPPPIGMQVAFEGTSLGKIRYASGDVTRVAPLVVGHSPPTPISRPRPASPIARTDWLVGLVAGAFVLLILTRAHLRRPPRPLPEAGPGVEFLS